MAKLIWNVTGERLYETGIEKAVLYIENQDPVKWSGLSSVSTSPTGGENQSLYFEGRKYSSVIAKQEYKGEIRCFDVPFEFNKCLGVQLIEFQGLLSTNQNRSNFNLSYVTKINSDVSENMGYKFHLLYNAKAVSSDNNFRSINKTSSPLINAISITAVPPLFNGKPTSPYKIIDSRKFTEEQILNLENCLYGTDETPPKFPSQSELISLLGGVHV